MRTTTNYHLVSLIAIALMVYCVPYITEFLSSRLSVKISESVVLFIGYLAGALMIASLSFVYLSYIKNAHYGYIVAGVGLGIIMVIVKDYVEKHWS